MPPDPAELADARPDPGPPLLAGPLPGGRIWIDSGELSFAILELQTAVALLEIHNRLPSSGLDAGRVAERIVREALARLPGWLLEEPS
jgi:hypothetical protein